MIPSWQARARAASYYGLPPPPPYDLCGRPLCPGEGWVLDTPPRAPHCVAVQGLGETAPVPSGVGFNGGLGALIGLVGGAAIGAVVTEILMVTGVVSSEGEHFTDHMQLGAGAGAVVGTAIAGAFAARQAYQKGAGA